MIVILSGEGPTDLGQSKTGASPCSGQDFAPGPMAALVEQAIEARLGYSVLDDTPDSVWHISETELAKRAKSMGKRHMALRGSKQPDAETGYFYKNAEMLALFALEKEQACEDISIAVLFRDSDGTRSTSPALWESKFKSMEDGFRRAAYSRGVAMLPKPKSEAWLLCLARDQKGGDCAKLENLPGNDNSPNSAKQQLDAALGQHLGAAQLVDWVKGSKPDFEHLSTMPSFASFCKNMQAALNNLNTLPVTNYPPPNRTSHC